MNYKDKTFEIDNDHIKFKNKTFILYLPIFIALLTSTILFNRDGFIALLSSFFGVALGLIIIFRVFILLYWRNNINLSDISFVEVRNWNSDIDKMRNFWGVPKFRYHFPTGLDKKSSPKVIFVHRKKGKLVIGFAPTNCIATISAFRENGIKVVE
ncbi:MAG TPA: hypothetical protein VKA27_01570 [Sunxiuqinia sp.]|nr:hypothetical protein [Sunxiuqinia sp.]